MIDAFIVLISSSKIAKSSVAFPNPGATQECFILPLNFAASLVLAHRRRRCRYTCKQAPVRLLPASPG